MYSRGHFIRAALLMACISAAAGAQVTSSIKTVALTATKGQAVTLTNPTPASQMATITDSTITAFDNPFTLSVSWDVQTSASTLVKLVAYFDAPAQAFATEQADYIASSHVEISTDGGSTWQPVTQSAVGGIGTSGGSLVLWTSNATQGEDRRGNHTVTFQVRVNLTNSAIAAGSYTATLRLAAIAN
jgi:hypothetical protein